MNGYLAAVVINGTTIPVGLILIALTALLLVIVARSESNIAFAIIALILGVLLASAFPTLARDINQFFTHG